MADSETDPNLDAIARGLGSAQADAKEATTLLRGAAGRVGALAEIELLKADVRHGDERVTEMRELFSNWYRQLDGKMDTVLTAVKAMSVHRLNPLVTALLVVSILVMAVSSLAIAGVAVHAYASSVEHGWIGDR